MLGVLKKKLKHDLKHDVEELDLPQATTASRILKDRSPDVTLLREEGLRTMAEEIGVPSLTLQFEKAPTRAGSREGGLPSRRSLYLVPTRGWGVVVDTAEHSHRMLKGSKKKNTVSPGLRIRNGRAPLKKRASKRM
jgi:hypothetical protein